MAARYPVRLIAAGTIARPVSVGMTLRRAADAGGGRQTGAAAAVAPLTITKEVDPASPIVGSNVTFTITVTNNGDATAQSVVVTEDVPAGLLVVSSTPSVGTYVGDTWTIGTLAPAASATLEIVATVLPTGSHANVATLDYLYPGDTEEAPGEPGEESTPTLPAGSDVWSSDEIAVIPFQAYADAVSEFTPAGDFGADDSFAPEDDLPGLGVAPLASAWWQLTVPAGVSNVLLTVDTWLTTGGRVHWSGVGDPTYPGDTNLSIWKSPAAPPVGTFPTNGVIDFDTLTLVDQTDDSPDPSDPSREYTSKLEDVALDADSVYWIRVDTWGGDSAEGSMYADGIAYRLRISLDYAP